MNRVNYSRVSLVASHSLGEMVRQKTVLLFACLFIALVIMSAYLGWSANSTVDSIYRDSVSYLQAGGFAVPPNPVLDSSPLSILRNLTVYVALIGVLAAIVMGYHIVAQDRKSGVLPLIATRIGRKADYAVGKLVIFTVILAAMTGISMLLSLIVLYLLPAVTISHAQVVQLLLFHLLAFCYMLIFGMLALGSSAISRKQSIALLIPVTAWLVVTFIFPALTLNLNPTAAINPVSALAAAPDSPFFNIMNTIIGPISIAENFNLISAHLLDYYPRSDAVPWSGYLGLFGGVAASLSFAVHALGSMKMEKGEFDE